MNPDLWPFVSPFYNAARTGAWIEAIVSWQGESWNRTARGRLMAELVEKGPEIVFTLGGALDHPAPDPTQFTPLDLVIEHESGKMIATITDSRSGSAVVANDAVAIGDHQFFQIWWDRHEYAMVTLSHLYVYHSPVFPPTTFEHKNA